MNWRIYLRLLRTKNNFIIGLFYFIAGFFMTNGFLPSPRLWTELHFLTATLVAPLLLGYFLASAAHEQMHRPAALLLPDLYRKMQRATVTALAVIATVVTLIVSLNAPTVPPQATFGLVAGLLTVCFPNRYRWLQGLPWIFGLAALWAFFVTTWGTALRPSMMSGPWIFCLAGLGLAALNVSLMFSRRFQRERAVTPYFSFVPLFLFDSQVSLRLHNIQGPTHRGITDKIYAKSNWPLRRVADNVASWMQVLWHAGIGGLPGRGFWQVQLLVFGAMLLSALPLALLMHLGELNLHGKQAFSLTSFWIALSDFTDPWSRLHSTNGKSQALVALCAAFGLAMSVLIFVVNTPLPRLNYPVSRKMMSRVVFALCIRQLVVPLLGSVGVMLILGFAGQIGSGKFLPVTAYGNLVGATFMLAAFQALFLCGQFFRSRWLAFLWSTGGMIVTIIAGMSPSFLPNGWLLTGGLPIILVGGAASYALLWWSIRRCYLHTDLVTETGFIKPLIQIRIAN